MKKRKRRRTTKRVLNEKSQRIRTVIDFSNLALLGVIAGFIAAWFIWEGAPIVIGLMLGLLFSLASLSYLDSEKWPPRPIVTSVLGGAIGFIVSANASVSSGVVLFSTMLGLVVGFFISSLVQYFTLP